jgi:hypothetical protein
MCCVSITFVPLCRRRMSAILERPAQSISNARPRWQDKTWCGAVCRSWGPPPASRIPDRLRRFLTRPRTISSGAGLAFVRPSGLKSCFGQPRRCGQPLLSGRWIASRWLPARVSLGFPPRFSPFALARRRPPVRVRIRSRSTSARPPARRSSAARCWCRCSASACRVCEQNHVEHIHKRLRW